MPVVPTPPTIYDGIVPSSTWNQVRDAIRFLQRPPIAQLRRAAVQSLGNGTFVALDFDTEDVDSDVDSAGGHDSGIPSRFTARYPGWYDLGGGVGFAINATGVRVSYWAVNGTAINGSEVLVPTTSGFSHCHACRPIQVYLAAGDYVELYAFQNSGGALNTASTTSEQPSAAIRWVSA